ncbi:MAG: hypothetical protein JXJ04_04435 [Spirochaetales bacterium]|nr:hypothetical protein [Spirochaetales bacterium]
MNSLEKPEDKINRLATDLYRRARICYWLQLFFTSIIISLIACFAVSLINQWKGIYLPPYLYYPAFIFIAFLTSIIISHFHTTEIKSLLIKTEKDEHLKETISTAYEYLNKKTNPFYNNLIRDAAKIADTIILEKVFPLVLLPKIITIIPLVAMIVLFSLINVNLDLSAMIRKPFNTLEAGDSMEEYSIALNEEINPDDYPLLYDFAGELAVLGMELQTGHSDKQELQSMLQKMESKVKENMDLLLDELDQKEYSPTDLALIRLLAFFSSDSPDPEGLLKTLNSIEETYDKAESPEGMDSSGEETEMDINKTEDKGEMTKKSDSSQELDSYPDYLNALRSLMDQQQEAEDKSKNIVNRENDFSRKEGSTEGIDSEGKDETALSEINEESGSSGSKNRETGLENRGEQFENKDGEAGRGTPEERELSVMTDSEENKETDTIVVEGSNGQGKVLELIKQLTGNTEGYESSPGEVEQIYKQVMEQAVSEGSIPREYSRLVKDYFLLLGFSTNKENTDELE